MLHDAAIKDVYAILLPGQELPADPDACSSPVQPSSLDLHMGGIFVPDAKPDESGGVNNAKDDHNLEAGQTAVVVTKETINMPSHLAAVGFPPTRISNNGVLMTNPGHVDPGFEGRLSFTLVNMGRESYPLKVGDVIVTLVIFNLDNKPDKDYGERCGQSAQSPPVKPRRMERLSPDMLNVDKRIKEVVHSGEQTTRRWTLVAPTLLALVVAIGTIFGPIVADHFSEVDELRQAVNDLETQSGLADLTDRISEIEERLETDAPASGASNDQQP